MEDELHSFSDINIGGGGEYVQVLPDKSTVYIQLNSNREVNV